MSDHLRPSLARRAVAEGLGSSQLAGGAAAVLLFRRLFRPEPMLAERQMVATIPVKEAADEGVGGSGSSKQAAEAGA